MSLANEDNHDDAFEAGIEAFEAAWRTGNAPEIRPFIDAAALSIVRRTALLHELIRIDLEYRWSDAVHTTPGAPRRWLRRTLENYLARLPELGSPHLLPLGLIVEEYQVRRLWGDRPDVGEYVRRFPDRTAEITAALNKADRAMEREIAVSPVTAPVVAAISDSSELGHVPQFDYRDFILEAFLGGGGIGKVYRAWWKRHKQHVAVKMLRKNWWRHPEAHELFFREAAILMELRHANIVSLHGIGHIPRGGCFLVIDLIDGGDLARPSGERVPIAQATGWVAQAADGLSFAHRRGIVHRDIKPSNLLLDRRGKLHVADFGLAITPSLKHASAGHLIGTVAYMAPEQLFSGPQPVGPAADIFGLGAVLYTLLTGRPPYEGRTSMELVELRLARPLPLPVRLVRPDLPETLERTVARCLATDPAERFATADELAAALRPDGMHRGLRSTV